MTAITVWIDESVIKHKGKTIWVIGQFITNSYVEELDFLKNLKIARKQEKTWDSLHACQFTQNGLRKLSLLENWIDVYLSDENSYFHAFVFTESVWRKEFSSLHDYWANQICFGLANKMKPRGIKIQTMFSDVRTVTVIMDRRAASTGYISEGEIQRRNDLDDIYEKRIFKTLSRISTKLEDLTLRFSFANSRCFDALQLCDCLTHMVRSRLIHEENIDKTSVDDLFLNLWNKKFSNENISNLKDFIYDPKFNYFETRN